MIDHGSPSFRSRRLVCPSDLRRRDPDGGELDLQHDRGVVAVDAQGVVGGAQPDAGRQHGDLDPADVADHAGGGLAVRDPRVLDGGHELGEGTGRGVVAGLPEVAHAVVPVGLDDLGQTLDVVVVRVRRDHQGAHLGGPSGGSEDARVGQGRHQAAQLLRRAGVDDDRAARNGGLRMRRVPLLGQQQELGVPVADVEQEVEERRGVVADRGDQAGLTGGRPVLPGHGPAGTADRRATVPGQEGAGARLGLHPPGAGRRPGLVPADLPQALRLVVRLHAADRGEERQLRDVPGLRREVRDGAREGVGQLQVTVQDDLPGRRQAGRRRVAEHGGEGVAHPRGAAQPPLVQPLVQLAAVDQHVPDGRARRASGSGRGRARPSRATRRRRG